MQDSSGNEAKKDEHSSHIPSRVVLNTHAAVEGVGSAYIDDEYDERGRWKVKVTNDKRSQCVL